MKAIYQDAHGVTEQVFSAPTAPVVAVPAPPPTTPAPVADAVAGGAGINLVRSDLNFILKQIKIAEAHAAGTPLTDLIPNIRLAFGLRTVDGSENNLLNLGGIDQTEFGAADNVVPAPADPRSSTRRNCSRPVSSVPATRRHHADVLHADQRQCVRLAAAHHLQPDRRPDRQQPGRGCRAPPRNPGAAIVISPGLDGLFGTADDKPVVFIPNVTPDFGLTAPFNAWMTFFGQFFDHGLDLVTKGGNGTIFIPLKPDDPLFSAGRARNQLHGRDAGHQCCRARTASSAPPTTSTSSENTTTPFVDQNQTYTSHPSHQVFLRAYELDAAGHPVATGKLITNRDLGADGKFGTADDRRDRRHGDLEGGEGAGARPPRHQSDGRRRVQRAAAGHRRIRQLHQGPERLADGDDEGRRRALPTPRMTSSSKATWLPRST